jgi:hypothetical protein
MNYRGGQESQTVDGWNVKPEMQNFEHKMQARRGASGGGQKLSGWLLLV